MEKRDRMQCGKKWIRWMLFPVVGMMGFIPQSVWGEDQSGEVQFFPKDTEEEQAQKLTYALTGEGLRVSGLLYVNCCGEHFMRYAVTDGKIRLVREDRGDLCDCAWPHPVDFVIPGIPMGTYEVFLTAYDESYPETADRQTVVGEGLGIDPVSDDKVSYEREGCRITGKTDFRVELFDLSGHKLWQGESRNATIEVPLARFAGKTFLCRLLRKEGTKTIKLMK